MNDHRAQAKSTTAHTQHTDYECTLRVQRELEGWRGRRGSTVDDSAKFLDSIQEKITLLDGGLCVCVCVCVCVCERERERERERESRTGHMTPHDLSPGTESSCCRASW